MSPDSAAQAVLWLRTPPARTVVAAHLRQVAGTFRAAGWRVVEGEAPPIHLDGPLAILEDPWCQPLPVMAEHLATARAPAKRWRLPKVNGLSGPQAWTLKAGPYTPFDYQKLTLHGPERSAQPLATPWCGFAVAARGEAAGLLADLPAVGGWPPAAATVCLIPRAHMYRYDDPAGHARHELDPMIPEDARTIVDVGCGQGRLGERLRRPGRRVVGIEPDWHLARQAARRLDVVLPCTAEVGLAALKGDLDCIVFADVLEHTTDAASVLEATVKSLSPTGRVIVSVPNSGWAPMLRALAAGRWDATLAGTQARDHFTPFTRLSLLDLAAQCGLRVVETSSIEPPLPWRLRLWAWCLARSVGGDPRDLLAAQWIFSLARCSPKP